ncbi:MAG: DUF2723 domain-containing protein [Pseudomonadota bacterium]
MIAGLLLGLFLLFFAAPSVHWLDSTELTLTGVTLGTGHPPGEVPFALVANLLQLVPIGDLAFRSTLASLLASVGVFLVVRAWAMRWPAGSSWRTHAALLAVAFSAFGALQGIRTEVYALSAFLTLVSAWLWSTAEDPRRYVLGCLVWGFAALNHPLIALTALPFADFRRGFRFLPFLLLGGIGLIYLPLRVAAGTGWNFGDPGTWPQFLWFIQAKLYRSYEFSRMIDAGTSLRGMTGLFLRELTPIGIGFAIVGFAALVVRQRVLALRVMCALGVGALAATSNFRSNNPDALGYLLPAAWIVGLTAIGGLHEFSERKSWGWAKGVAALCVMVWLGTSVSTFVRNIGLRNAWGAHVHMTLLAEEPPAAARVRTASFSTYSFLRYAQLAEGMRSDLRVEYRGLPDRNLAPAVDASRPVIWEPSISLDRHGKYSLRGDDLALASNLVPVGWFYRVGKESGSDDWRSRLVAHVRMVRSGSAGPDWLSDEPLLLNYLLHVLWVRTKGDRDMERVLLRDVRELFPTFTGYDSLSEVPNASDR